MLITDVENLVESKYLKEDVINVFNVLLASANDWPIGFKTFEEFNSLIEEFIGKSATKQHLQEVLDKIAIDKNSWQAESLTQLLDIYLYYDDQLTLKEILHDLKKYLDSIEWGNEPK